MRPRVGPRGDGRGRAASHAHAECCPRNEKRRIGVRARQALLVPPMGLSEEKLLSNTELGLILGDLDASEAVSRLPLLQNEEMTPKAFETFSSLFYEYAREGMFTRRILASFLSDTVGQGCHEDDPRVSVIFNRWDRGLKGELSLQDFLRFYAAAAKEREELVWDHLQALGFDDSLRRHGATNQVSQTHASRPHRSDDPAERRGRLEETLNRELKLHQRGEFAPTPCPFQDKHTLQTNYDYGNDHLAGHQRTPREAHEAAKQVIGGIREVFPAYGGKKGASGEVRSLMERISSIEEEIYANAAKLKAPGDPNWLKQRDDLAGSAEEVNSLHASIVSLRLDLGGDTKFGRMPPRRTHLNAGNHTATRDSWKSLTGTSEPTSMTATRMNLRIGVDGIDPVRQLGREAWFTVMGPCAESFKGATLRQGAELGSPLARQPVLPPGTRVRVEATQEVAIWDSHLAYCEGKTTTVLRAHVVDPVQGWADAKLLRCDRKNCGHCYGCTDGLLPSEEWAREYQQRRDQNAVQEIKATVAETQKALLDDLRLGREQLQMLEANLKLESIEQEIRTLAQSDQQRLEPLLHRIEHLKQQQTTLMSSDMLQSPTNQDRELGVRLRDSKRRHTKKKRQSKHQSHRAFWNEKDRLDSLERLFIRHRLNGVDFEKCGPRLTGLCMALVRRNSL